MRFLHVSFLGLCLIACLSSCSQTIVPLASATPTPTLSAQAQSYLRAALDIMQAHSLNRKKINWNTLRRQALQDANGAKTPAGTYPALRNALDALGDHHSRFVDPQTMQQQERGALQDYEMPSGQLLASGVGDLQLPTILGSEQTKKQYALLAQEAIKEIDQRVTCGWIVDLRYNTGGQLGPMLVGVGPILGEGIAGFFAFPDGTKQNWGYVDGQAQEAGSPPLLSIPNPYHLKYPNPPVAILTSASTASSGEALAVAFRGRPHSQSFGQPTYGLPTANESFRLRDGAYLMLTDAIDVDRAGHNYDGAITPDVMIPPHQNTSLFQAATTWLHSQQNCQK